MQLPKCRMIVSRDVDNPKLWNVTLKWNGVDLYAQRAWRESQKALLYAEGLARPLNLEVTVRA